MKVYFANNSSLSMKPIDAWVESVEEGCLILRALAAYCAGDAVIMRARLKQGSNDESRYLGIAASVESDDFLDRVSAMGT